MMPKIEISAEQIAKICLAVFLLASIAPLTMLSAGAVRALEGDARHVTSVGWKGTERVALDGSLPDFFIDRDRGLLSYRGKIDAVSRSKLKALTFEGNASPKAASDFEDAVDRLIYENSSGPPGAALHILWLGGLAGVLGVQLRSMTNFIGRACYKNGLDLKIWWPYYVVRPASGFLLGAVLVVIVQAGFINLTKGPIETFWWVAIAFLAGFGEEEFTQRLRLITKTLFGEEKASSSK